MVPILRFHEGTLVLENWDRQAKPPYFEWDPRTRMWRTLAIYYSRVLKAFEKKNIRLRDEAQAFTSLALRMKFAFALYPHQKEALDSWQKSACCGTVVLPTGSGKSLVALYAMDSLKVSTLIVSPTLDLMNQWYDRISDAFGKEVGVLGGGYHEIRPLTVTTYDSAYRHIDRYGNRFGLLIFDEIHHLPAPNYSQIPELSLAPYRLGLTATYRRADAQHLKLTHLIGPVVFERKIKELAGEHLSEYEIHRVSVSMTPQEKVEYDSLHKSYEKYVRERGIKFYGRKWETFIKESTYVPPARQAMLARKGLRQILFNAEKKLEALESLLKQHSQDRVIVFTEDNDLVYTISRRYLIPALTHQTNTVERKAILDRFRRGEYRFLVTSKVLNEGVDIPEANVAIILGGSASPTEHLQRLGRILRKKSQKRAILYEIITGGTQETNISYRRRASDAYQ